MIINIDFWSTLLIFGRNNFISVFFLNIDAVFVSINMVINFAFEKNMKLKTIEPSSDHYWTAFHPRIRNWSYLHCLSSLNIPEFFFRKKSQQISQRKYTGILRMEKLITSYTMLDSIGFRNYCLFNLVGQILCKKIWNPDQRGTRAELIHETLLISQVQSKIYSHPRFFRFPLSKFYKILPTPLIMWGNSYFFLFSSHRTRPQKPTHSANELARAAGRKLCGT
jgi:hypothetical protein